MAFRVCLADHLGKFAVELSGGVAPEGPPLVFVRLGVGVVEQRGSDFLEIKAGFRCLPDAVLTEACAACGNVLGVEEVLTGLDVVQVIASGEVAEERKEVLANLGVVGAEPGWVPRLSVDLLELPFRVLPEQSLG